MDPAPPPLPDFETRIQVWAALADLYLDTDVAFFYDHIVTVLATSPYPPDELERILFREVHPALYPNLLSVAGEWAGFEPSWLNARILQVRAQPTWRHYPARLFESEIRDIWRQLAPRIVEQRDHARSTAPAP